MKFYEVQPALEKYQRIRRKTWLPAVYLELARVHHLNYGISSTTETINVCDESGLLCKFSPVLADLIVDDWEVIEYIPEIKLFRSKDIYFICPKCQRQQEQLVYVEDRPEEILDCRFCGQKFKFGNLEEMKNMYYSGQ